MKEDLWQWLLTEPFGHVVLYGGGVGCVLYLLSRLLRWSKPDPIWVFESVAFGCGIVMGVHLAYCTFHPDHLVHMREGAKGRELAPTELVAKNGRTAAGTTLIADIEVAHSIHIFGAGVLTAALAAIALGRICILKEAPRGAH